MNDRERDGNELTESSSRTGSDQQSQLHSFHTDDDSMDESIDYGSISALESNRRWEEEERMSSENNRGESLGTDVTTIPYGSLYRPLNGLNLRGTTLAEQIGNRQTLLVFLRHFGCPFCRETTSDLRTVSESKLEYPDILFFFHGDLAEGKEFFDRFWPEAPAIADPNLSFYEDFGISRARLSELLGPKVLTRGIEAVAKGHFIGKSNGDPWVMPGLFLVEGEKVLWSHKFRHAGDHPDFRAIPSLASGIEIGLDMIPCVL